MKATGYRQCLMVKHQQEAIVSRLSYVPEPFCKEGMILKLKDGDYWSDGWKVISAGSLKDADLVEGGSRQHLYHRDQTDLYRGELKR